VLGSVDDFACDAEVNSDLTKVTEVQTLPTDSIAEYMNHAAALACSSFPA